MPRFSAAGTTGASTARRSRSRYPQKSRHPHPAAPHHPSASLTRHGHLMTLVRRAVGSYGERRAAAHLSAAGMRIIATNWRCAHGEIDIIAWDGDVLVFCEVKTRRSEAYGPPSAAVVGAKARRLRRLAAHWLATSPVHPRDVRFDVVAVWAPRRGPTRIEHLRGAF